MECVTCVCVWLTGGVGGVGGERIGRGLYQSWRNRGKVGYVCVFKYLSVADIENPICLRVFVGPGFVSTSPAFMRSSTRHPAGPHDWIAVIGPPLLGAGGVDTIGTGFARPL